jgi:hypothetical protein
MHNESSGQTHNPGNKQAEKVYGEAKKIAYSPKNTSDRKITSSGSIKLLNNKKTSPSATVTNSSPRRPIRRSPGEQAITTKLAASTKIDANKASKPLLGKLKETMEEAF